MPGGSSHQILEENGRATFTCAVGHQLDQRSQFEMWVDVPDPEQLPGLVDPSDQLPQIVVGSAVLLVAHLMRHRAAAHPVLLLASLRRRPLTGERKVTSLFL